MSNQRNILSKKELKSPLVLLFIAVYIFMIVLALLNAPTQAKAYIGMSLGYFLLIWLVLEITKKIQIPEIKIRAPGLEIIFACIIVLIFNFAPWPHFTFGDKWNLNTIVRKEVFLFVLPLIFLSLRKNSPLSLGLSLLNWKQNIKTGAIVLVCMGIPSVFFVSNTASLIISGKLSLSLVLLGFPVLFIHNIAMSGLPEEFFYRVFIQTRLSYIFQSKLAGILITSLYFGFIHVPGILRWFPGMKLSEAFCRAFFIQGFMGLLLGILWERTRNLISVITVHSGINALNNLGSIISLVAK